MPETLFNSAEVRDR
jgi:ribonucleoside-diphosphate reductase alpha chain